MLASARSNVELAAGRVVQRAHLLHSLERRRLAGLGRLRCARPGGDEAFHARILLRRELADLGGDLHRAELRPAHRAEVGGLGALRRERLVVVLFGRFGIEAQVELVAPAELEAGA